MNLESLKIDEWDQMIDVNLKGFFTVLPQRFRS